MCACMCELGHRAFIPEYAILSTINSSCQAVLGHFLQVQSQQLQNGHSNALQYITLSALDKQYGGTTRSLPTDCTRMLRLSISARV